MFEIRAIQFSVFLRVFDLPGPVGAVSNRTGSSKKGVKSDNFLKLNDPVFEIEHSVLLGMKKLFKKGVMWYNGIVFGRVRWTSLQS